MQNKINNEYFEWLFDLVCDQKFSRNISYRKLLTHLHCIEFTYSIPNDENRAEDGIDLRYRFACEQNDRELADYITGPCSVLEMIIALSVRCEESIMDDPDIGNRTNQWFWSMITNLGLGSMSDDCYDRAAVDAVIERFLNREYEPDGRGGLFTVRNHKEDLREIEIWYQLCYYLDNFV